MLVAYEVALDLVRALRPVVVQLRNFSSEAADQVERAASSIVLNLAEGGRHHGRDPRPSSRWHTAAPGRSSARSTWRMRGAGRSKALRPVRCSIESWPCCGGSLAAAAPGTPHTPHPAAVRGRTDANAARGPPVDRRGSRSGSAVQEVVEAEQDRPRRHRQPDLRFAPRSDICDDQVVPSKRKRKPSQA